MNNDNGQNQNYTPFAPPNSQEPSRNESSPVSEAKSSSELTAYGHNRIPPQKTAKNPYVDERGRYGSFDNPNAHANSYGKVTELRPYDQPYTVQNNPDKYDPYTGESKIPPEAPEICEKLAKKALGFGIASLVCLSFYVFIIPSILSIIFGIIAKKAGARVLATPHVRYHTKSRIGKIFGLIGFIAGIILSAFIIFYIALIIFLASFVAAL